MNQAILKILDEMIENIGNFYSSDDAMDDEYYRGRHEQELETLQRIRNKISSLPSDTQWIDVNKKKPEKNTDVLCYITTKEGWYCDVLMFDGLEFVEGDYALGVTHWQPLPTPPNN